MFNKRKYLFPGLLYLLLFAGAGMLYSAQTDTILFTVKPLDAWPPCPVTDLLASPNSIEGRISFNWTAPGEDDRQNSTGAVEKYNIRYATFSIASLSEDTTAWWVSALNEIEILYPGNPGSNESYDLDLLPALGFGATYYFALRSLDDALPAPFISPIDINAATPGKQVFSYALDLPPSMPGGLVVSGFTTVSAALTWTGLTPAEKTRDFDKYLVYRSSTGFGDKIETGGSYATINSVDGTAFTDNSVTAGNTYFYRVSAIDLPPLIFESPLSAPVTQYIQPAIPEYSITGYIKDPADRALSDVKITLSGASSKTAYSDTAGYYEISGIPAGTYTLTPSKLGWNFIPVESVYSPLDSDIRRDFAGTYVEEAPREIEIPIGENDTPVRVTLPENGGCKIIAPENSKERKGVINPERHDEVPIIFKSAESRDNYLNKRFTIRIFNLLGELVDSFEKTPQSPDDTWIKWIPKDISSGIYIIHIEGPGVNIHKKIPILR